MRGLYAPVVCLILVFVTLDLGCTSREKTVECTQASDCSGEVYVMCIGGWDCVNGKCVFNCKSDSPTTTTTLYAIKPKAQKGEFCGGIAGVMCEAGLQCRLDGSYPDAGGVCVEKPEIPPEGGVECKQASDCQGDTPLLCLGEWSCINGKCVFDCKNEPPDSCSSDSDCAVGGCSGQICALKEKAGDIITTCEWRSEYSCYRMTSCGCVQGTCRWKDTKEFTECLSNLGAS